jgi:hypothetical protein
VSIRVIRGSPVFAVPWDPAVDTQSSDLITTSGSVMGWLGSGCEKQLRLGVLTAADLRVSPRSGATLDGVGFTVSLKLDRTGLPFGAMWAD